MIILSRDGCFRKVGKLGSFQWFLSWADIQAMNKKGFAREILIKKPREFDTPHHEAVLWWATISSIDTDYINRWMGWDSTTAAVVWSQHYAARDLSWPSYHFIADPQEAFPDMWDTPPRWMR